MTVSFKVQIRRHSFFTSCDCLILGVFDQPELTGIAADIDAMLGGKLTRLKASGDIDVNAGKTLWLHEVDGIDVARVLVVSLGKADEFNARRYKEVLRSTWRAVSCSRAVKVDCRLPLLSVRNLDLSERIRLAVVELRYESYRFVQMKSKLDLEQCVLESVVFDVDADDSGNAQTAVQHGLALANGMDFARDLGNLPGNVCTPSYLAQAATQLAKDWTMKAEVLGHEEIEALKMGSFLSVARASTEAPQLIVLQYEGGKTGAAPVVLIGKGITFDSGGISLKPGAGMDEMKYDMCGAAAVLGTLRAIAEIRLPLNVVAIVPACENMPGGNANKPGDIVTSMKGLTIEVLNTDAEGRLILCDALTYAERFKPAAVIDVATLTGACVIALGDHHSGLYAKDEALAAELLQASSQSSDAAWRLPLDDEYQEQLKSNFADVANIGGRKAGSVTAACFLSRFAEEYPWAHLDIAGTAWTEGASKGATGRPVPLLTRFLENRAGMHCV
ncbi:leucyl aminopeptidase [Paraburkholderia sp. GAS333]|uniref:leucyl aminopeptidase n=1 Tax=Paraburkholderia sp. GAS333 TaxID=3156279 RepID=UPI003D250D10